VGRRRQVHLQMSNIGALVDFTTYRINVFLGINIRINNDILDLLV
jgi:hypothetical protein